MRAATIQSGDLLKRPTNCVNPVTDLSSSDAGHTSEGKPDETGEEDNDIEDDDNYVQSKHSGVSAKQKARHALTGRGVTLAMLMDDKLIEPGENVMSIEYLGQKFTGDLLSDSRIRWREENKLFGSPSAWALHCKKIVNPAKKSGCGWASVRYKGRKLDVFKSSWVRKQKPISTLVTHSFDGYRDETESCNFPEDNEHKKTKHDTEEEISDLEMEHKLNPLLMRSDRKLSVKYASIGRRSNLHDPSTMVECYSFADLGKLQPFSIRAHSSCLLMMDFHSHLTTGEIIGYIAGKWNPNTQYLTLEKAYPCKSRLWDLDNAANTENEIRVAMEKAGLVLIGWYHSHPHAQPDPSLQDIDTQMHYQLNMKSLNSTYQPCVGVISSPFSTHNPHRESQQQCYWIMPPNEQRPFDYGMPMVMEYEVVLESTLPPEILTEMLSVVKFYRGEPDEIQFNKIWSQNTTYLDKILTSLQRYYPRDPSANIVSQHIQQLFNK